MAGEKQAKKKRRTKEEQKKSRAAPETITSKAALFMRITVVFSFFPLRGRLGLREGWLYQYFSRLAAAFSLDKANSLARSARVASRSSPT